MTHLTDTRWLRTPLAAERANLSASKLEKERRLGRGPAFHKIGKTILYDIDDIDAWLASFRQQPAVEPPANGHRGTAERDNGQRLIR